VPERTGARRLLPWTVLKDATVNGTARRTGRALPLLAAPAISVALSAKTAVLTMATCAHLRDRLNAVAPVSRLQLLPFSVERFFEGGAI
jgi:hypothetical protein